MVAKLMKSDQHPFHRGVVLILEQREDADAPSLGHLLRACRERPSSNRDAKKGKKRAPPHRFYPRWQPSLHTDAHLKQLLKSPLGWLCRRMEVADAPTLIGLCDQQRKACRRGEYFSIFIGP